MRYLCLLLMLTLVIRGPVVLHAQENVLTIYDDALASGWQNWSWSSTVNFEATGTVHSGQNALATTFDQGWAGLYLRADSALPDGFDTLRFWVWGTGQTISIQFYDEDSNATDGGSITPPANTWTQIDLPLASTNLWGLVWMETTGSAQPQFLLDDIQLLGSGEMPSTSTLALNIDAAADQHPISPYIYGLNFADPDLAADIRLPVNRWGGNAVTRYNWQNDTSNHASDWYFENIPNDNDNPAALPNDSSSDQFVAGNITIGTDSLITVPLIGWTPSSREFACGFSVTQYGEQQDTDTWQPDCGNGVQPDGSMVTGNDPADTSTAIGPEFVQDWIRHLIERFGNAENGGVRFYNLDNEPSLWNSTHRDVHPDPLSYDELRDRTYEYAAAIKAVDPAALTLGPVEWGWVAYFYSALDVASDPEWWNNAVDRNAHGGEPLVQWYLEQMQLYEQQNGVRILDYLDLHYYPQGDGVSLSSAGSAETQALRLRSTRSLWDPTYVDESWIGEPVMLLPRMRDWVDQYYPGTKLAVSEYNFGALDDINGALAQADVLGIFGREGLDLATLWDPPSSSDPGAFAFRMYRNYDGAGSTFGETSVQAASTDQAQLAVYAALRSDGALTLMVINKTNAALNTPLSIQNFEAGTAEVYRYSAAHLDQIVREADVTFAEGHLDATFPPNSITLLVLK
jgi:hypothetical protein